MKKIEIPVGTNLNEIINQINDQNKINLQNHENISIENWVFDELPESLTKMLAEITNNAQKDTALITTLVILSSLIKNYQVYYENKYEDCQLYFYILGDPAQGKGSIAKYRALGLPFHRELNERYNQAKNEYKLDLEDWKKNKPGEEPKKPLKKFLFLAGNNTKASLLNDLKENEGYGLIFETETDTLYTANKNDFGNFTDILRKGFHSENTSVSRVSFEDGTIEIENVILSIVLTSTLDQCFKIMPNYDNGLFSRFIFYILPKDLGFKKVFEVSKSKKKQIIINKIGELFKSIGLENLIYNKKEFILTSIQQEKFQNFFDSHFEIIVKNNDKSELAGSFYRLGLICTRIAMLLTYYRNFEIKKNPEATNEELKFSITDERNFLAIG